MTFKCEMSWRDSENHNFNPHGGRNAFRGSTEEELDTNDRAASFRAIRSFTQSIDADPELDTEQQNEGMKSSDTNDTIIEVLKKSSVSEKDPCLGETQKYKMSVPGPGHSEQEHEMHESLIQQEEDDADMEVESALANVPSAANSGPPSAFSRHVPDSEHAALRREYSNSTVQRRRPTTPTSQCTLEMLAFVAPKENEVPKTEEKIKVSIPSGRRRKSDMPYSDFYESMSQQIPSQARSSTSGRTTPLNGYDGDILEENPAYKTKAPPPPVIHRRTSMEWENFEEMKERMESGAIPPPKPERTAVSTSQDDDLPTFSEDMQEERAKVKKVRRSTQEEPSSNEPTAQKLAPSSEDNNEQQEDRVEQVQEVQDNQPAESLPDTVVQGVTVQDPTTNGTVTDTVVPSVSTSSTATGETVVPCTESTNETENANEAQEEESYDPNAYPGYIWNYESQQWEVDPNYVHPENYDYSSSGQEGYDASQYAGYDQSAAYSEQTTTVDPYNAGYDQSGAYVESTPYDYTAAAYHVGYDQGETTYDATYTQGTYDYSTGTYQQTTEQYEYSSTDPNSQYDQSQYAQGTYDQTYDYNAANYGQAGEQGAYDQNAYDQNAYDQAAYDQTAYNQTSYDPNAESTGYSYDYSTQSYNYDTTGTAQSTGYEATQGEPDPTAAGYDQPQGFEATTAYDYTTAAYHVGYDQGEPTVNQQPETTAYSSEPAEQVRTEETDAEPQVGHALQQSADVEPSSEPPVHRAPPVPPPPPVFATPLFKQAPPPSDPFGWDASAEQPAASSPAPPGRPAPPSRPEPSRSPLPDTEEQQTDQAAPVRPPPVTRPPPPRPSAPHPANVPEKEEDAWTQFKKMTEKVNVAVKSTEEQLKTLNETSAANDIKDESYLAQIGGEQGYVNPSTQREIQKRLEEQKNAKLMKKKLKQQGKKAASPTYDPDDEDKMDKAAQELAAKLASKMNMENWSGPPPVHQAVERVDSLSAIPPRKRSSLKDVQQDSGGSLELPAHLSSAQRDSLVPKGDLAPDDPILSAPAWADLESSEPVLPPSESGFFSKELGKEANENGETDAFGAVPNNDPFAPADKSLIEEDYDPFAVQPVEDIMAAAKAKAEEAKQAQEAQQDIDFFGNERHSPALSTPTPEGGSPIPNRPDGFEDDFKCEGMDNDTPTPLYDEDDSEPLTDFIPKFEGEGWELMIRHPIKKKSFMAERCWKPCYVRLRDHTLFVFNSKNDNKPIQELLLQASYSLSDTTLQAYDVFGKIHTVKLQYVQYKEKVGIRPGQISRLVEGHVTKYGLPLEHTAQCNVLLKFGSLAAPELQSFVSTVEDILFKCPSKRDTKPIYKQDEVQIHCYDEYSAFVDKDGLLSDQKARVRLFCLAFVTGSPFLEIGLNDRRRQGKEIVRRKDILPMYTERWIRFEKLEFHNTVDMEEFEREQVIRLSPPDGCFFEVMRFRVRPPRNREKALNVKCIMKIAGSKVELRMEVMAAAQVEKSRGGKSTRRQIPCEDITIRFPIPEAWIYIFREERHWGVGSVHSKKLRPGKVKNLKDRLLGAVQSNESNLIEVAIGEAKYEHVYRSLVWRIPRLPEKHHAAYKSHLLKCRFELSSFDLMPETFLPRCEVDFTMPLATVSNTVVRSVSVEQHEDSDRVEKFVRYVAKCQYKVEIDYVQCADLEVDTLDPSTNPEDAMNTVPQLHQPQFEPNEVQQMHEGYRIDFPDQPLGNTANDSSSDDDDEKPAKMPIIQIDMKNYGY